MMENELIEESMKRIQSHDGIIGTIVVNNEGSPIMSNLDNSTSVHYAELIQQVTEKARVVVRDLDPFNDLIVFRMCSKKFEIMMAPGKDFIMIVIRNNEVQSLSSVN